jgi:hypothetical protein
MEYKSSRGKGQYLPIMQTNMSRTTGARAGVVLGYRQQSDALLQPDFPP